MNEQLRNVIRIVEDILVFAAKKKIADPLAFLKKVFKPDFDVSSLEEKAKETELPNVNLNVFFQRKKETGKRFFKQYIRFSSPEKDRFTVASGFPA